MNTLNMSAHRGLKYSHKEPPKYLPIHQAETLSPTLSKASADCEKQANAKESQFGQFPEVPKSAFGLTSNLIPLSVGEAVELAAINAQVLVRLKLIIWIGST